MTAFFEIFSGLSDMTPRLITAEVIILSAQMILYFGCEIFQHDHSDVRKSIDDRIPLIPAFSYVYASWFPLIALYPLILYFISPFEYAVYQLSIITSDIVSTVIYLMLPTRFERPALGNSFWERSLSIIYRCDFRGSNCTPSLHCIQSFIVMMSAFLCPGVYGAGSAFVMCLCVAIVISTLLTKQHVLIDVITSIPAAIGMYTAGWIIVDHFGYQEILSSVRLM